MLIIYSMTPSATILKLKEIMFKNSRHSSHSLYLWSSMIKGLHKEELNSVFFFIVQWIAIQAKKENHISHKTFPDQSVSKYMWCTPPSPEILEVPVVCLYYRNQCFNKEDTLWYHLCVTNTDSSKLSETKQGDHEKSPKAFESNEMKHQHCWEVDVS